jgi:nitrite reductase/ring-hydroxylating ferredoxin subunit
MGTGATVAIASLYPAVRFLEPLEGGTESSLRVGRASRFPPDSAQSLRLGAKPVLVLRDKDGRFHAYVATCPHLHCIVRYSNEQGDVECGCHGGRFALSGAPTAGPPREPLKVLRVSVVEDEILVSES